MSRAAARIATISAWAVGSRSASVRLPAEATIAPSRTITQPTGTSPALFAFRASSSARSMKDGMISPGHQPSTLLSAGTISTAIEMTNNNDEQQHGTHKGRKFRGKRLRTSLPKPTPEVEAPIPERKEVDRVAKVIARAGLASRREAEVWIEAGR